MLTFSGAKQAAAQTVEAYTEIPACPCHDGGLPLTEGGTLSSGNYYLTGNVVGTFTINGTVNLCLNGYVIDADKKDGVLIISANGTLNLYDCGISEDNKHYYTLGDNGQYVFTDEVTDNYLIGGIITGGTVVKTFSLYSGAGVSGDTDSTFNMYGGNIAGICLENRAGSGVCVPTFNMYAGKICGNRCTRNGTVYMKKGYSFSMSGGEISNNSVHSMGGGVDALANTTLTLSGSAKICNNYSTGNSRVDDLYIREKLTVGEFNEDAYIGIFTSESLVSYENCIANNNSGEDVGDLLTKYFFNDKTAHVHKFDNFYEEEPATCSKTGMAAHYICKVVTDGKQCNMYFDAAKNRVTQSGLVLPKTDEHKNIETLPAEVATCSKEGKTMGARCKDCGTVTTPQETIPKTAHIIEKITGKAATCTEEGLTEGEKCSACQTVTKQQETIPKTAHTIEKITGKAATCTEEGLTEGEKCSVCQTVTKEQQPIPKTEHTYQKGEEKLPTETEAGYTEFVCSACGHSHRETIPELGHKHDYKAEVTQPTCTEKGFTTYTCSGCNDSYKDDYRAALGHNLELTIFEPDCETDGYTRHACSRCEYFYDDEEKPALGHDYSGGPIRWNWADNYFTATATFECKRGDNHSEEVPATVDEEHTTATCTQPGDAVFVATVILNGEQFTDTKSVSGTMVPHKYVLGEWVWDGFESATVTYKCSVCGDSGSVSGEAGIKRIEPDCEKDGLITYTVEVEYPYLQKATDVKTQTLPATGHNYAAEWVWDEDFTAHLVLSCDKCDKHESPAVKVTYDEGSDTYTATAEYGGKTYTDTKKASLTAPDDTDDTDNTGKKNSFPWILILIGGILLLLFIIALIVIFRRNREEEPEEYEADDEEDDEDEE